ncbi:FAD-binding oxidoreductase [Pseudohoeflea coraliihabitans]|uniref:FAD-binding oxidoreductase n=1 Tax=Pseudohoeflea coraliihabitans TaxID=2860393 RepID=A0ABS6WQK0_9HYPH|nr:FAD-binding oxidoreductase [Pseudohoeflea sp. DP4N28-3]MBW3098231.1 FAD-binding oxidoreductase [Pseudohoeflea sp. DP4N28-3]
MRFDSWGRIRRQQRAHCEPAALTAADAPPAGLLAFGNGRSYGDSCHNDAGRLMPMQPGAVIHHFDADTGILEADAGVTLAAILAEVMPKGWFLAVTPGTAQATLGGAIANDVHGKNHHRRGSFGHSVLAFDLMRSDQGRVSCSPSDNGALFKASIGGMGLTGVIGRVRLQLMRVPSANIRQRAWRFFSLDGYFDAIDAVDAEHEYSVAWIDQLATGGAAGRGVLMAGDHDAEGGAAAAPLPPRFSVPVQPPVNLLNRLTLRAFNALYFGRAPKARTVTQIGWRSYFHPLDAIGNWNRLYGPRGLYQHQSVFPAETARQTTLELMACARAHGHASFLTVLKRFGERPQPGLLSFARPGFTLTLDFANRGGKTVAMLDALDGIVVAAGGAVNPYKDQRMSPDVFAASFPEWGALEAMRDPKLMSDFWRRTAMQLPADGGQSFANQETFQTGTDDNLKQMRQPA